MTSALMLLSLLVAAPLIHRATITAEDLRTRIESRRLQQLRNAGFSEESGLEKSKPATTPARGPRAH